MKLDINKIELKRVNDNIYQILYDNNSLKFWSPKILVPFGIDNEYNKYLMKLEVDENDSNKYKNEHIHLKRIIMHLEKMIKEKIEIEIENKENDEFKSILKKRFNKSDMIECRIKTLKTKIITEVEYEDKENNYLKTIFDIPKQSYVKVQLEINGLWDYRNEKQDKNKCGLIVYITKIIVCK